MKITLQLSCDGSCEECGNAVYEITLTEDEAEKLLNGQRFDIKRPELPHVIAIDIRD